MQLRATLQLSTDNRREGTKGNYVASNSIDGKTAKEYDFPFKKRIFELPSIAAGIQRKATNEVYNL